MASPFVQGHYPPPYMNVIAKSLAAKLRAQFQAGLEEKPAPEPCFKQVRLMSEEEFRNRFIAQLPGLVITTQGYTRQRSPEVGQALRWRFRIRVRVIQNASQDSEAAYDDTSGVYALLSKVDDWLLYHPTLSNDIGTILGNQCGNEPVVTGLEQTVDVQESVFIDFEGSILDVSALDSFYVFYTDFIPAGTSRTPPNRFPNIPKEVKSLTNGTV